MAEIRSLARVVPEIVTTNFALPGKRSANGKKRARGRIFHVGHRYLDGKWGPYAFEPGEADAHRELFESAQRVTAAMVAADAPYNQIEQTRTRSAISALRSTPAGSKLEPLLNDTYFVGVFEFDAGKPSHIDPNDDGGGLFVQVGTGKCMFALPEFEVYVRAKLGDVLYINTPRVLHGACVPPDEATVKSVGQNWSHICKFNASRRGHVTYGVSCPLKVSKQCPGSVGKKRRRRRKW